MQQSLAAMQLALRVLAAVTHKRVPDPQDVAELRKLGPQTPRNIPVDELACEVIQLAIKHRALVRAALQEH